METSTITSHAFINGIMERKAITFPVNKTGLLVAMRLNYPAPKESVPQKIDMLFLQCDNSWRYRGENNDMYQTEHDTLFSSIRTVNRSTMAKSLPTKDNGRYNGGDGILHRPKDYLRKARF